MSPAGVACESILHPSRFGFVLPSPVSSAAAESGSIMNPLDAVVPVSNDLLEEAEEELSESQTLLFIGISVGLVIMAGLMSGLTIGLMAMDEIEMEVRQYSVCRSRATAMLVPMPRARPSIVLHESCPLFHSAAHDSYDGELVTRAGAETRRDGNRTKVRCGHCSGTVSCAPKSATLDRDELSSALKMSLARVPAADTARALRRFSCDRPFAALEESSLPAVHSGRVERSRDGGPSDFP